MNSIRFQKFHYFLLAIILLVVTSAIDAAQDLISLFPLEDYDQTIAHWIKPSDADYNRSMLSKEQQEAYLTDFYNHYFATQDNHPSPWNPIYIKQLLKQLPPHDLLTQEKILIQQFGNKNKSPNQINYGENFHPYDEHWIQQITANMNLTQFKSPIAYKKTNRAIAVTNLNARYLPANDPSFYSYQLPGQGYPFDNLQFSAIWAGTPVYIIGQTKDQVWSLVLTPELIAWVETQGLAKVSNDFVKDWQQAAKKQLAAITKTSTSIRDDKNNYLFSAYIGAVFPVARETKNKIRVMIPVKDLDQTARISYSNLNNQQATIMPLSATPHHFASIMSSLINRPYGWGNMYFYNDCSSELKSLYTPFGIWLPRQAVNQATVGKQVDMSQANLDQRMDYLMQHGHKFMTIVYIGGHVFMYLGNYPNPNSIKHEPVAMTYQDMWGLSPPDRSRRVVIGQSVLFPLLKQYPEDTSLNSPANGKYFKIELLDMLAKPSLNNALATIKNLVNP